MKIKLFINMTLEVADPNEAERAIVNVRQKAEEAAGEIGARLQTVDWTRTRTRKAKANAADPAG